MSASLLAATATHLLVHRGHHSETLPVIIVTSIADTAICILLIMKIWAYGVESLWVFGPGGRRLRESYMYSYHRDQLPRTYEMDIACGRPRKFTRRSDVDSARLDLLTVFGYVFKTPLLVVIAAAVSIAMAAWIPSALAVITACLMVMLILFTLGVSLTGRLVMGPFDQLNPDLAVGKAMAKRLYPGSSPLGRYVLVLVGLTIVAFTAIYANISTAVGGAFTEGGSVDPIRWLYFTSTIASTVGFGDIHATSDVGRTFVLLQLFAGSLLVTWIVATFFGDPLPPKDPDWRPTNS
jgi:Ion channel